MYDDVGQRTMRYDNVQRKTYDEYDVDVDDDCVELGEFVTELNEFNVEDKVQRQM